MSIAIPNAGIKQLVQTIATVNAADGAAANAVTQAVTVAADSIRPANVAPAAFRAQLFAAALPKLDAGAAHVIAAKTAIEDAAAIEAAKAAHYADAFGTTDLSGHTVDAGGVLSSLAGQASAGRINGIEDAHNGWYAAGINWIVRTDGKQRNAELQSAGVTALDNVAGRNTGAPLATLRAEADATKERAGKADHRQAVSEALKGNEAALNAVAYTVAKGAIKAKDFEAAADEGVPSPYAGVAGSLILSEAQEKDLQALGQKLYAVEKAFDANRSDFKWEDHGNAIDFARNSQFYFVNRELGRDTTLTTLRDGVAEFDKLTPEQQIQNIRSIVAAIAGTIVAARNTREVLATGSTSTQQHLLNNGSQAAIGEKRVRDGRILHAQVVAAVAAPEVGYLLGIPADPTANERLSAIRTAIENASQKSGYELAFAGPSAASSVAVDFAGEFLSNAFPERFASEDAARGYAKTLFLGGGYGAARKFAEMIGIDTSKLGTNAEIKAQILEAKKDDWGIDGLKKIEADGASFTDEQQVDFNTLMTLFNATWMTTQEGRARSEEKAGKGDGRVRADQRDVYQDYIKMLRSQTPMEAIFRIAQDLMEAQKKSA